MIKKLICIMTLFVIAFTSTSCKSNELAQYKVNAIVDLEVYIQEKGRSNYSLDSWKVILKVVENGKTDIDIAGDKTTVDKVVLKAKGIIDAVLKEDELGIFYSLQDAYDQGLLTIHDLQSIANYLNNGLVNADVLNAEVEKAIKETAAKDMRNDKLNPIHEAMAEGFTVQYYGTYNGGIAVLLSNRYLNYSTEELDITIDVAGVRFKYNDPRTIEFWKKT